MPRVIAPDSFPGLLVGRCLRVLLPLIGLLSCLHGSSQRAFDWRSRTDHLMEQADSLALRSQQTFHLRKFQDDKPIRETWHYTVKDGKVVIFQIRYMVDSTEFTEIYYLNNSRLICMEQYESASFEYYEDNIKWGKVMFFDGNSLKLYVTVGRQRPALSDSHWDREMQSMRSFEHRFAELRRVVSSQ